MAQTPWQQFKFVGRGHEFPVNDLALIVIIALFMMRVTRADLAGTDPAPVPPSGATSPNPA